MKTTLPWVSLWVAKKILLGVFLVAMLQLLPFIGATQTVTTGKSYANISRPNGGTFLPGDILEIRATIAVTGGSNAGMNPNLTRLNFVRYNDTINLAKFTYIPNSLVMQTNDGRPQVPGISMGIPAYTDAADTDSAHIELATGRLRFNIGDGAAACNVTTQTNTTTNGGRLWGSAYMRPSFFGNTCIRVYAYRVRIINITTVVDIDSLITLNAGNFRYRLGAATADSISRFSPYQIRISPDYGLCSNSIGANAIVGESGGTFGAGAAQNRAGGTTFVPLPYTFINFGANNPNDNFYGLANRTSADGSTNPNIPYSSGTSRVFTVWDIIGDHTGAVNPLAGNPPTNTGYAVIINASYETNRAFTQTINGLCENTYYEFSAWFRNICRRCSSDSSGRGATTTGFVGGMDTLGTRKDSSGVRPNLSFQINGEEFYTSGNLIYTGRWIKKGFVYRTKPGQVSMTVTIRNNAPGGGGNDWAIDDIAVSTCLPNMKYSPTLTPNVCVGNALTIRDTVRSFFNNYVYYKWQRSTNGGSTWSDIGAPFGPVPPGPQPNLHNNGVDWEYVASYTIPPAQTLPANSGDKYRLVVATSLTNLSDLNCRSTDAANTITLNVITCGPVLNVNLISFNGKLDNKKANLTWVTTKENEDMFFDVEKSYDGNNFTVLTTIKNEVTPNESNSYSFVDPSEITTKAYYRIKMRTLDDRSTYSRILQLSAESEKFSFTSVINPFKNNLSFDLSAEKAGPVNAELVNQFGKTIRMKALDAREGVNQFFFENTSDLQAGMYVLKAEFNGVVIYRKVMKQ